MAALVNRLRQTEEVLVQERLARQTAEAAQQTAGAQVSIGERVSGVHNLVDTKAIGKPPTFSGDVDPNGRPEGMPRSQWSFIFRRPGCEHTAAASGGEGVGSDGCRQNNHDRGGEATFDTAVLLLALTCRGTSLQVVRFGFEAWKQLCGEFEPRHPSQLQGMQQALLSPTRTDDPVQTTYQRESKVEVYEEQSGDLVLEKSSWQSCRSICVTESSPAT